VRALGIELDEAVEVRERGPDDVFSILLDPTKTNQDFDWQVTTPLADGVGRTVESYRPYGIGETYTHLKVTAE
jgi:UDP-glucose 4-epimerase